MSKAAFSKLFNNVIPPNTPQRTVFQSVIGLIGGNGGAYIAQQLFTHWNTPTPTVYPSYNDADNDLAPSAPSIPTLPK